MAQAKLVKQEQQAIDALYEKKRKGAEVSQKMYVLLQHLPICLKNSASNYAPLFAYYSLL